MLDRLEEVGRGEPAGVESVSLSNVQAESTTFLMRRPSSPGQSATARSKSGSSVSSLSPGNASLSDESVAVRISRHASGPGRSMVSTRSARERKAESTARVKLLVGDEEQVWKTGGKLIELGKEAFMAR